MLYVTSLFVIKKNSLNHLEMQRCSIHVQQNEFEDIFLSCYKLKNVTHK